jgi:STIP1 family protein 1
MTGPDPHTAEAEKAQEFKAKGNDCFNKGDWEGAEKWYSIAISHDPSNPLFFTNRAMTYLKFPSNPPPTSSFPSTSTSPLQLAITDCRSALSLSPTPSPPTHKPPQTTTSSDSPAPHNMKAHFLLAQALCLSGNKTESLKEIKETHKQVLEDIQTYGEHDKRSGFNSFKTIMEWGLRIRKEVWEERVLLQTPLLSELLEALEEKREKRLREVGIEEGTGEGERLVDLEEKLQGVRNEYDRKIEECKRVFRGAGDKAENRRDMPDWAWDGISFNLMLDPVMTKTGQSYERLSIYKHLERSQTDPLTREPLRKEDLRPNLGLRQAVEDFVEENGWAVEW